MKKIYFLLLLLSFMANAQIVNIPDVHLKARLLMANNENSSIAATVSDDGTYYLGGATIDLDGDHEISVAEAQSIQYLNVWTYQAAGAAITDLTGLEAFTDLEMLNFNGNAVSTFDLSALTQLKSLSCNENQITSIDLQAFPNLMHLYCAENQITALDFSGLQYIESVNCSRNQLTSLDFHTNQDFMDLGCGGNNNLTSINIQNGRMQNTIFGIMQCDGWYGNPALTSICADANEIPNVTQMLEYSYPQNNIEIVSCLLSTQDNLTDNASIIYPNPTRGSVTIKSQAVQSIELYDVQGRLMQTFPGNQETLDISNQANGVYLLKIKTEKGNSVAKLIKQ